jgi:SAM-dependent methyltransferase
VSLLHAVAGRALELPPARALRTLRSRRAVAGRTHVDSWKRPEVAAQMLALNREELAHPDDVAPYRTFLALVDELCADPALPVPARFLEYGCGVGHYAALLERRHPGRFAYTGADYAPEMVRTARRQRPDATFVVDDVFAMRLDLDAFDVVCPSCIIDVLPEWEAPLERFLGCAAPFVLLHRQRVGDQPSRVDVAPGYEGQTTYRTYVNRTQLAERVRAAGRTIARELVVSGDVRSYLLPRA